MLKFINSKLKYVLLVLSVIFLAVSITYFANNVSRIGLRPFNNISADKMTGREEFLLYVKEPAEVYLLHHARIGSGEIEFALTREDGEIVTDYKLDEDSFIKRVIELDEGAYHCSIKRDVTGTEERFRFYYDRRFVTQEYIQRDSRTEHNS